MRASGFSSLSSLALLALLTAARLAAQETATPSSAGEIPAEGQPFVDSIDVQVVNLEVFVTDPQGQRVGGLTREDFEVREDGRPIQISNFYAVTGGQTEAPGGSLLMAAEPGEDAAAAESLPLEQQLNLAIVIDDLSLDARGRNRLLLAIGNAVLPHLRPDDRVLVGLLGGSNVRVVQRLTSDPGQLRAALEQLSRTAPAGIARLAGKRDLIRQIEGIGLSRPGEEEGDFQKKQLQEGIVKEINASLQDYTRQRALETRNSLKALSRFIDSLAGLPGRKAVLYAGGGLSLRPGEAIFQAWEQKFLAADSRILGKAAASRFEGLREDLTDDFQELVARANANRVTFYNLGATEEVTGVSAEASDHHAWTSTLENLEKMNLGESLSLLAGGTGGLAGVDLNDPRNMLQRMREDFDSFYSLGYVPERGPETRELENRKIEVSVRGRKDLTVRHREARRDQTHRERMTGRTLAALILDPGANPLGVAIDVVAATRQPDKETWLVEALVKFPLSRLVLLPGEGGQEGRVTLFLGAQDAQGRLSPIQEIRVPIRIPPGDPEALAKTAAYRALLELRPEAHRIAISMRDEVGNTDSAMVTDYTPGVKP